MHIAIVGGSLSGFGGGAPRSMALHAKALETQGIKVSIFTGYSKKYPLTPDLFGVEKFDITASRLLGPSVLGLALKSLFKLAQRSSEFDVIHLNGHWNLTTFIGALIARFNKVPYVITARGHLGTYDFKHLWFLKLFLYPLMEITNIKHAALIHVCSNWEQSDSARALKHADKIIKLPNAVDFSEVLPCIEQKDARSQLGIPENAQVYLFLSRVAPDKCPDMLIKSWAKAKLPPNSILIIAGPADRAYEKMLKELAISQNVEESIKFTGYVDKDLKRYWLSTADVFVLPSTDDSFSVSVIEAAASGLHCMLSPYVGASEYLKESQVEIAELNEEAWTTMLRIYSSHICTRHKVDHEWCKQFSTDNIGRHWKYYYKNLTSPPIAK